MARWTDLATWRGPSINSGDGDGRPLEDADALAEVRGLIVHIAEGFFEGTIAWQLNADANVSSHFIAGRGGGRAQMVDTHDRAWTQSAGNTRWLSVENEGFTLGHRLWRPGWHELTGVQAEFIAQLFARIHQVYGVPLQLTDHPDRPGLGYHSMGAEQGFNWGHSDCPGEPIKAQLPAILNRAIAIVNGENVDAEDVKAVWQYHLAPPGPLGPGGYNMQDHLLNAERQAAAAVALLEAIAKKVDLDPAELTALKAAAEAGARAGVVSGAQQLAAAVANELKDELGLSEEQAQAASERALRKVLGQLGAPAPNQ